ncbi:MAG: hypothetical protein ACRDVE_07750 [Actinocrinis sp.]
MTIHAGSSRAVALLVSYGGSPTHATYLKRAAHLVVNGRDPRAAAAPASWPTWREDALEIVDLLFEEKFAQVHARMAATMQAKVGLAQLETAWRRRTADVGAARTVTVARSQFAASGAVLVDLACDFVAEQRVLRVLVLPNGELGGLMFRPLAG